jgi:hypothetical protein
MRISLECGGRYSQQADLTRELSMSTLRTASWSPIMVLLQCSPPSVRVCTFHIHVQGVFLCTGSGVVATGGFNSVTGGR